MAFIDASSGRSSTRPVEVHNYRAPEIPLLPCSDEEGFGLVLLISYTLSFFTHFISTKMVVLCLPCNATTNLQAKKLTSPKTRKKMSTDARRCPLCYPTDEVIQGAECGEE
uniref:Uncharacterized protein n=1 Tax=Aegilops tauschii TaxID=37682 RepID=R7W1X3_AEGTA